MRRKMRFQQTNLMFGDIFKISVVNFMFHFTHAIHTCLVWWSANVRFIRFPFIKIAELACVWASVYIWNLRKLVWFAFVIRTWNERFYVDTTNQTQTHLLALFEIPTQPITIQIQIYFYLLSFVGIVNRDFIFTVVRGKWLLLVRSK